MNRGALGVAAVMAISLGGFLLMGATGAAGTRPATAAQAGAQDLEPGRRLYLTGCSSCHGLTGEGTAQGPPLRNAGAGTTHFYLSTGRMPLDQPRAQADRKRPAYDAEQIRQITAYVASLGPGPEIPRIDHRKGDLAEGNQLYAANCAACHNSAGSGGALGSDYFAPRLTSSTPLQVAEAIRIGPGAMPRFGPVTLDDHEVASIVRYVEHLKDPTDRGGAPLGRVGPVPEGIVAWLVGLGGMLLVALWIGTRT